MALNFSRRPIFPSHLTEDNLVSQMRIANGYLMEGIPDRSGDGDSKNWQEDDDCFDYGRDRAENRSGSQESVSTDVIDLLPLDPFGMDISSTLTAFTGWLEDLEVDYGGYDRDEVGTSDGNFQLIARLNFILNDAMRFQGFPRNVEYEHYLNAASGSSQSFQNKELVEVSCHGGLVAACNVDGRLSFENDNVGRSDRQSEGLMEDKGTCCDGEEGAPHAALMFSLGYLSVPDLLVVEKVCRSLCSTVRDDPLLWRSIHIDQPLNEKITDDVLLQLTNRAQGKLQCLSLVECPRITDDALKYVLESNPRLTKLSVPGCTRLSIDGIVNSLKAFKSMEGTEGVKHLRIGGLYGVTHKHFEELKFLLGTDSSLQQKTHNPHFYHRDKLYLSCEDDRSIDIETCPKCQNLRLVYDCPAEGCLGKEQVYPLCRACTLCIARCAHCGRCINDSEYEETFSLDLLCSDCGKCHERQVRRDPSISAILDEPIRGVCLKG